MTPLWGTVWAFTASGGLCLTIAFVRLSRWQKGLEARERALRAQEDEVAADMELATSAWHRSLAKLQEEPRAEVTLGWLSFDRPRGGTGRPS